MDLATLQALPTDKPLSSGGINTATAALECLVACAMTPAMKIFLERYAAMVWAVVTGATRQISSEGVLDDATPYSGVDIETALADAFCAWKGRYQFLCRPRGEAFSLSAYRVRTLRERITPTCPFAHSGSLPKLSMRKKTKL